MRRGSGSGSTRSARGASAFVVVVVTTVGGGGASPGVAANVSAADIAALPAEAPAPSPARTCDVPLAWRVERLDAAFGLDEAEALAAVRAAAGLWEGAAGRTLFSFDEEEGFPIRFIHDERQARVEERARRHRALDEENRRLQQDRSQLEELRERLAREREWHESRTEALQARLRAHRAEVEEWNRRGGAPPAEVERLSRVQAEIDAERRAVNAEGDRLNELVERVNARTRALNGAVEAHNRAAAEVREAFPPESVQSGHYRESRRTLGPWNLSVEREISVFQFDDPEHLVLVLAHELGHALGLAHSGEPAAVMFVNAGARRVPAGGVRLHPRDVEQLRRECGEGA